MDYVEPLRKVAGKNGKGVALLEGRGVMRLRVQVYAVCVESGGGVAVGRHAGAAKEVKQSHAVEGGTGLRRNLGAFLMPYLSRRRCHLRSG